MGWCYYQSINGHYMGDPLMPDFGWVCLDKERTGKERGRGPSLPRPPSLHHYFGPFSGLSTPPFSNSTKIDARPTDRPREEGGRGRGRERAKS